jgi:hypothetical protein
MKINPWIFMVEFCAILGSIGFVGSIYDYPGFQLGPVGAIMILIVGICTALFIGIMEVASGRPMFTPTKRDGKS